MDEFTLPSFLDGQSAEEIMERMAERLPKDIDISEGNDIYNLLMPTAVEKERYVNFILKEAIRLIFPQYCGGYDEIADYHAETCGMRRKEPFYATGKVTMEGEPGTLIPKGTIFSTISVNEAPSLEFEALEECVINEDGTCELNIRSMEPGVIGNVAAGTILLSDGSVDGIASVTNEAPTSGGVEEESTESLLRRITEYQRNQEFSFIGCSADYKRWAEEVDGVGTATVISAKDDSGLVTIVLTDSTGSPANESLCQAVYDHIMQPTDPPKRLAHVNALLSVVPPETIPIHVSAEIQINSAYTLDMLKEEFMKQMLLYLKEVPEDQEVRYSKVHARLSSTAGVEDFRNMLVNEGTANVPISVNEFPLLDEASVSFSQIGDV